MWGKAKKDIEVSENTAGFPEIKKKDYGRMSSAIADRVSSKATVHEATTSYFPCKNRAIKPGTWDSCQWRFLQTAPHENQIRILQEIASLAMLHAPYVAEMKPATGKKDPGLQKGGLPGGSVRNHWTPENEEIGIPPFRCRVMQRYDSLRADINDRKSVSPRHWKFLQTGNLSSGREDMKD